MIAGADEMRVTYGHNYFLITVSTFSALPQEQLQELVEAVSTPEMLTYADNSAAAFAQTFHAAVDRLDTAYAAELSTD